MNLTIRDETARSQKKKKKHNKIEYTGIQKRLITDTILVLHNSTHSLLKSHIRLMTNNGCDDWFPKMILFLFRHIIHQHAAIIARFFIIIFWLSFSIKCSQTSLTSTTDLWMCLPFRVLSIKNLLKIHLTSRWSRVSTLLPHNTHWS